MQLQEFKQAFLQKRRDIVQQLSDVVELDVDGDDTDAVQGHAICGVADALNKLNLKKLAEINLALDRIDEGTYGECEECGEDIGLKRLLASPSATHCIVCAEKLEKERKGYRR